MRCRGARLLLGTVFAATIIAEVVADFRSASAQAPPVILFVTQPPFGKDFESYNSAFANHHGETCNGPRGGDLYIRYGDGTLRNLTQEAGYGLAASQEIAVREPSMHWSGTKALFSMVIGGTTMNDFSPVYWQIYEVSGLSPGDVVHITKLPQPSVVSNVSPIYGTDDRILFISEHPREGNFVIYPQFDEYEARETNTGIWSMNPDGSDLKLLDHSPSGNFTPVIASDGRVVFTRWDHLQRDQINNDGTGSEGAFNYASETSTQVLPTNVEVFPEVRIRPAGSFVHGHQFNFFFPWEMNEDGSALETLNHVGRHELLPFVDSANGGLPTFTAPPSRRTADVLLQLKEDPGMPGLFWGTTSQESLTHGAGQIITLFAPLGFNADDMQLDYITDPITADPFPETQTPPPGHPGHFRNPLPLSDGTIIAVRSASPFRDRIGATPFSSRYDFHFEYLRPAGQYWAQTGRVITAGISKSVSYWDNCSSTQISYSGPLWELDPVEVRGRPVPNRHTTPLPQIEAQILSQELGGPSGVAQLHTFLTNNLLALVVSRNVTRRADKQQEYNLKIAGSSTQTVEPGAVPTEIAFLQFLQGDHLRGFTKGSRTVGRRLLARPMHDGLLPTLPGAPAGAVQLAADGSMAAFVPARRALSWQTMDSSGNPVVRERYWVTFAPGEMRTCTNCHGINRTDVVLNQPPPTNPPEALRDLARWWRSNFSGTPGAPTPTPTPSLMATFCVDESADDGYITGSGNTYPPPATVVDTTGSVLQVKRGHGANPAYQVRVALARFPTGGLPDAIHITRAQLTGRIVTSLDNEQRHLVCEFYPASNWPIDLGDYAATPPSPATRACDVLPAVGGFAIDLDPVLADQSISRTGDSGLRLHMGDTAPLPPAANNDIELEAWEGAGSSQLCLVVSYTLPVATPTATVVASTTPTWTRTPSSPPNATSTPSALPTATAPPPPPATATPTLSPTVNATPTAVLAATFCVDESGDDGYITGAGSAYPPPAAIADTTQKVMVVKRGHGANPPYQVRVALARFPTASLPDAIRITAAQLTGRVITVIDNENRDLVCEFYAASNWPIDVGDYVEAPPSAAARACQAPLALGPFAIDLDPALADQSISRVGDTGLRLHLADGAPLPPAVNNNIEIEAWDNAGTSPLCLTVSYVPLVIP